MSSTADCGDMAASVALKTAKKELRQLMKQRLLAVPRDSTRVQSSAVFQSLVEFKPYAEAKSVGVYLAMPDGEIQTEEIVSHALSVGKTVFVPYLHKLPADDTGFPTSVMDMITLHNLADFRSLERDKWEIPTIPSDSVAGRQRILGDQRSPTSADRLDLMLMPGMAFNFDEEASHFTRLGHGKGYYDYFMHRYAQARGKDAHGGTSDQPPGLAMYGLSLKEQWLAGEKVLNIPVGPNDVPLDGVILGTGEIRTQ